MPRVIWKGAISFGLVHVPVALYPAAQDSGVDFDWLDKRSMDPVGYKRINKRTGKEIGRENIVKGVKQDDGDYVLLSDDEIAAAYPKTTQTIQIEGFVQAAEISFVLLEKPYYLEPAARGEKVYALLREAMHEAGVIGIARVVLNTKEHLAALVPAGAALVLNTIRWAEEIRPMDELQLPPEGKAKAGLKDAELKMATQLIADMTTAFKPQDYADTFTDAIKALVDSKIAAGETEKVEPLEEAPAEGASNVVDLTELLKQSLARRRPAEAKAGKAGGEQTSGRKPAQAKAEAEEPAAPKTARRPARKRA